MFALALLAAAATASPYSFRSIPLGISLEDFKALPRANGVGGPPACTGFEGKYGPLPEVSAGTRGEKAAGIVKCVYYFQSDDPSRYSGVGGVPIGDFGTENYLFSFARDPRDGVTRLFEMKFIIHNRWSADTLAMLKAKFGTPTGTRMVTKQNGFGASISGKATVWQNGVSTIGFEDPFGDVTHAALVYRLTRLSSYAYGKINNPPVDKSGL